MFLLLPLTCVYYPVAVLPDWLQWFSWMLPPTYVFEGMRALLIDRVFRSDLMVQAFALNAVLLTIGVTGFMLLLRSARREGTLLQGGD
jgi:ABC-2 type transport system permease protein